MPPTDAERLMQAIIADAIQPLVRLVPPREDMLYGSPIVTLPAYSGLDGRPLDSLGGRRGMLLRVLRSGDCEVVLFTEHGRVFWKGCLHHTRIARPARRKDTTP